MMLEELIILGIGFRKFFFAIGAAANVHSEAVDDTATNGDTHPSACVII